MSRQNAERAKQAAAPVKQATPSKPAAERGPHDQHILVKEFIQGIVLGLLAGVLVGWILFA